MQSITPLLSIITPVYNVERYLERCVASIIEQSFRDWELILVDDGSTDNSGTICDAFALKDARIRVYHQSNAGASAARNVGLSNARGEYITFVDSDDSIAEDTYKVNIQYLQSDPTIDLLVFPIVRDGFVHEVDVSNGRNIKGVKPIFDVWYRHYPMQSSFCNKIIKNSIISDCRFIEGKVTGEDLAFASQLWDNIQHIYVSSDGAYYYNTQNANSVTLRFDKQRMQEKLDEMSLLSRYIRNHRDLHEYAVPFFVGKTLELFRVFDQYNYQMDNDDASVLRSNCPSIKYLFSPALKWTDGVYYSLFTLLGGRICLGLYKRFHH